MASVEARGAARRERAILGAVDRLLYAAMGFRVLSILALVLVVAPRAQADVVGLLDPEAAQLCGGSAHNPRCPPDLLGGACCGFVVLGGAIVGLRGLMRGKAEGPREGT